MDFREVLHALGIPESVTMTETLRVEWAASDKCLPPDGIPFLRDSFITEACRTLRLPKDVERSLLEVSRRAASDAAARALVWHFHYCVFHAEGYPDGNMHRWPAPGDLFEGEGGGLYALVVLSGIPSMWKFHQRKGISERVSNDTLSQINFFITDVFYKEYGYYGLTPRNVYWLKHHLTGSLYQLGRLQFEMGPFLYPIRVFRHRSSGAVLALSEGGVLYLADGQRAGGGRIHDTRGEWTSRLRFSANLVEGSPIAATGRALRETAVLDLEQWEQVIAPGDPALVVHIPGGERLAFEACGESFRAAVDFFKTYYPERPLRVFCTSSWILDTQLQELLPVESNLVRFQKEVYLFPFYSEDLHLLRHVLPGRQASAEKIERKTTLQTAIRDRLRTGRPLRATAGGCFLLPDDLSWGSQVYLSRRDAWRAFCTVRPPGL